MKKYAVMFMGVVIFCLLGSVLCASEKEIEKYVSEFTNNEGLSKMQTQKISTPVTPEVKIESEKKVITLNEESNQIKKSDKNSSKYNNYWQNQSIVCKAFDTGWEEHWGGHGGSPSEVEACEECLRYHGSCRYQCSVQMTRCESEFRQTSQPYYPYPPQPYQPQPPLKCGGSNMYGTYYEGGGCNMYGCWLPGGGCNMYGCWGPGGQCNMYGCVNETGSRPCEEDKSSDKNKSSYGRNYYYNRTYLGEQRPDRASAEDSAMVRCFKDNWNNCSIGYCTIRNCFDESRVVKSGTCRKK